MKDMRQTLLGFMTLLMLTPVLMCGMAFCPTMANAAEQQPCHQTDGNDGLMLVIDCMGVDLFQADVSNDIQPDLSVDSVDYASADLVADYNFLPSNINGIRGPPNKAERPNTNLSLILTTQRFRI